MLYEITVFLLSTVELGAFCWVFAQAIAARYTYGSAAAMRIVLWFALAAVLRYLATFLVTWRMEGLSLSDLVFELCFTGIYILLDVTQVAIVLLATHLLLRAEDAIYRVRARACLTKGEPLPSRGIEESALSLKGKLHAATLIAGGMILFVRLGGRMVYDIGNGAPVDGIDLAWMIFYYLTDIAIAVVCCFAIRYLIVRLCAPSRAKIFKKEDN